MTKPNDIPQDVWDLAYAIEADDEIRDGWQPTPWDVERLSRAIVAAEKRGEEREREACAALVEAFTPIRPAFVTEDEGGIEWPHPAEQLPIYQPSNLAAAIRKRGEAK